ncbi:MAG TPA: phytanoyl-CoA dioxygenase family protein [Pyrinomonadaceae bacterium]|jgi:ectoine hydroxylase-related dioxygenase (phytanoyl-CoA dioxygenase family)
MFADLSNFHRPLTGVFTKDAESADFRLSDEQISFFNENGYLTGVKILNDEQIEFLRNELSELMKPEQAENSLWYEFNLNESADKSKTLFHALGAWRISKAFHDLLWHRGFCVPASQLLNGAVRFWHDQLFVKPARDGGVVAWHQDYSYWTRTAPIAHLTCWIGLDDSTAENGCLRYVPRSHKWNLLPVTGLTGDMNAIQTVLSEEQKENFQPVAVELKAGEASFHHPLLVHGSFENFSARPRRAAVINVFRDGVKSDSDEPPLAGVSPVKKGEKMQGQFFPLLFP